MKREFLMNLGLDHRTVSAIMAENGRDIEAMRALAAEKDQEIGELRSSLSDKDAEWEKRLKDSEASFRAQSEEAEARHAKELDALREEEKKRDYARTVLERAKRERFASGFAEKSACDALLQCGPDTDADEFFRKLRESDPALFLPPENAEPVPLYSIPEPDGSEVQSDGGFEPPLRFLRAR